MSSFYAEKPGYDQSHHDVLSPSRSMRSVNQHDLMDHSHCMSPATEVEGKMRTSQRRRVPVACRRCRKRKIKCSGDSGDGQACSNCRGAGSKDCQFFRVNSHSVDSHVVTSHPVNSHKTSTGWPYPHVGAAITPCPQEMHPHSKSSHLSMGSPQTRMAAFPYQLPRSPEFDMSAAAHIFEQPINYTQSSSYAPSGALMDYATWSTKVWDSVFTGRSPNGNIYPDPEANLNQSQYAYMLPSQGISSDLAQTNSAPTAGSVSSPETTEPARTLPTPTSRGPQVPSSTNFVPDGTWAPAPDYKSSFWTRQNGPERPIPNPSQTQNRNKNKYVNINPTPEILFSYPLPTTAEETSSAAAPSGNGNGSPVYPVLETLGSEYPLPTRQIRSSSLDHSSGQRLLALTECSSDMYGYSTSEKKRGSGTLVSGLSYTRVPHRDTGALFSLVPDMPEYHRSVVESVHRPVEPLGDQGY